MSLIIDQMNRPIKIPQTPQRIVSVVPSQTELLFDLGLGERVIGITKFCIHPNEWYRGKKRVGGTKKLNIELIKQLKPDLIIGNKEENTAADILELEKLFPVWMSDIFSLEDVYSMIESLGRLLDVGPNSLKIKNEIASAFNDYALNNSFQKKWKTLYFIWKKPFMLAANDTFINTILKIGGFENAAAHLDRYPALTEAQLIELQPELILLSSEPYPFRQKHVSYFSNLFDNIPVLIVDGEVFSWYGSRLLHTASYLKKLRLKLAALV